MPQLCEKVKVGWRLQLEFRRGAHLSFQGREPVGVNTTIVCDAWPVRRLHSHLAPVPNYTA